MNWLTLTSADPAKKRQVITVQRKGTWSLKVSGNWRVTFKLEKGDALDVNYEEYH